ncbi:MAG: helix-turn-helix transcriptional regulator [Desulfobacterales bacterium]|nr:helix-turn-helix transcriptional regulator [Desulfobacterales bacterium]
MEAVKVGEKIKALRQEANISLQDLAEKCGYSTAVLSQIENHLVSPSLGVLVHLAKAMDVSIGTFFGKEETEPFTLIRKGEENIVSRFASKEGVRYGYTYESLGAGKKDRRMEPFLITLEPATIKNDKCYGHEGEEFIYVLEGRIDVTLGDHTDILEEGDCIYYNSTIPHRVQCHGGETAKILAVVHP